MTQIFRPLISLLAVFTLVLGLVYPLAITGLAQLGLSYQANGSLVRDGDRVVGSALVGQNFTSDRYFWPRPSATADAPYNAGASTGTNLGPTSAKLKSMVETEITRLAATGIARPLPADAATSSGSGLDPHISPEFARLQMARVAKARGLSETALAAIVDRAIEGRSLGVLGEPRVNVLSLNRALDVAKPS